MAVFGLAALWATPAPAATGVRDAVFVGNNWDGTAHVIDPNRNFRKVARINIIPDIQQRLMEIYTNPVRLGYFLAIRQAVGEGHDQFVDDMYSTPDGRLLIVSRPSLADVVAINLWTRKIVWRFVVDGQRADHMAMSPDGKHVAVSASTGNVVHILDTRTGQEVGSFQSGDSPHENNYSADGSRGSSTPASGSSTPPPTSLSSIRPRATAGSRSSMPATTRSSGESTWARSSRRRDTPT